MYVVLCISYVSTYVQTHTNIHIYNSSDINLSFTVRIARQHKHRVVVFVDVLTGCIVCLCVCVYLFVCPTFGNAIYVTHSTNQTNANANERCD